jgi:hypothetical protein
MTTQDIFQIFLINAADIVGFLVWTFLLKVPQKLGLADWKATKSLNMNWALYFRQSTSLWFARSVSSANNDRVNHHASHHPAQLLPKCNTADEASASSTSRHVLPDTFNPILRPSSIFCW